MYFFAHFSCFLDSIPLKAVPFIFFGFFLITLVLKSVTLVKFPLKLCLKVLIYDCSEDFDVAEDKHS